MPCDPELLRLAIDAQEHVIDAEHDLAHAQADLNRAVRRLQLAGASLREIAQALGLSHQRIHQMVDAAGGSRGWRVGTGWSKDDPSCSFCARPAEGTRLVRGPACGICADCVALASSAIETGSARETGAGVVQPVDAAMRRAKCSFCGKARHQVRGLASGDEALICSECLELCKDIVDQ